MVHYTVCDVSGQQETDFYAFLSVARDATTEEISWAGEEAVKEAPPDVHDRKADGVSKADLIAIVVDVLEDETKRGQYDRVLERIELRGSGSTSWWSAIMTGWLLGYVEHFLAWIRTLLVLVRTLLAVVRMLLAGGRMLLAWGRMLLAWFRGLPARGRLLLAREERDST